MKSLWPKSWNISMRMIDISHTFWCLICLMVAYQPYNFRTSRFVGPNLRFGNFASLSYVQLSLARLIICRANIAENLQHPNYKITWVQQTVRCTWYSSYMFSDNSLIQNKENWRKWSSWSVEEINLAITENRGLNPAFTRLEKGWTIKI